MIELKEVSRWVKATLKNSFQKAIEKILVWIIVAIIIAVLLLWKKSEVLTMLLTHEVAIFWLFVVAILFLIAIGIIHRRKTKEYDKLVEKTELPSDIITIKGGCFCDLVQRSLSNFPFLEFSIDVINKSYLALEPKKVEITCCDYYSGDEVGTDVWDEEEDNGYVSIKGYISVEEQLPKYGESHIKFIVPIKKEYQYTKWYLEGYVTYTNGEKVWNAKISTQQYLKEHVAEELKKRLKRALGEEEE